MISTKEILVLEQPDYSADLREMIRNDIKRAAHSTHLDNTAELKPIREGGKNGSKFFLNIVQLLD